MTVPGSAGPESPRGRLSVQLIVDEAMQLAHADGLAGLSMRKLAGRLAVEAMSLYYYVPSKAALQVLMADRSAAAVLAAHVGGGCWSEQLIDLLMRTYRAGLDNPALFEVLAAEPLRQEELPAGDPEVGSAVMGLLGQIVTLLEQGSVPAPQLAHTFRGLIALVIGFIVVQVNGLPLTGEMDSGDPAEGLRFTLELVLDGLDRRPTRSTDS